jgi:hypothetical protein
MIRLTDEMREALPKALAEGHPSIVATASATGVPDVAFKGSLMVFDDEHLAYWERSLGTTLSNVRENPAIAVMYWNFATRRMWKFIGTAEVHADGAMRDTIMEATIEAELQRDPERKGVGVLIRVERGQVVMEREG